MSTLESHADSSSVSSTATVSAARRLVNSRTLMILALLIGLVVRLVLVWQPVEELS